MFGSNMFIIALLWSWLRECKIWQSPVLAPWSQSEIHQHKHFPGTQPFSSGSLTVGPIFYHRFPEVSKNLQSITTCADAKSICLAAQQSHNSQLSSHTVQDGHCHIQAQS